MSIKTISISVCTTLFLMAVSCGPKEDNSPPPKVSEEEEEPIDTTPVAVTWEQLRSGELKKDQVIILDAYIAALYDQHYYSKYGTSLYVYPRRNQSHPFRTSMRLQMGNGHNEMEKLGEEYYHSDVRIKTNSGGTAVIGSHVQITGVYDPGFRPEESCTIELKTIELLDGFDESVLETAIELTDEKVKTADGQDTYYFMDAVLTMSMVFKAGNQNLMINLEPLSNKKVKTINCQTGYWTGTADDDLTDGINYLHGINGDVVEGDTIRVYGTFKGGTTSYFEMEEVVRLSKSEYELNQIEVRAEHKNDEFIVGCINAINEGDGESLEYDYRDEVTEERAKILMTYWSPEQPWRMKDNFLAVMIDQDKSIIGPLAEHELDSPNDERAYALCILLDDWEQFDYWYDGHWDEVDPAIEAYKAANQ